MVMGDVQLRRECRDGRDLVYAFLPSGEPVWVMDVAAGHEWWYRSDHATRVESSIRAQLSTLLAGEPSPRPVSQGPGVDLEMHAPGHAVLAQIADLHAAASSQTVHGLPGTLSEEIVGWCVGYVGEERVAAILATLGPEWKVLHSVPVGERGSDVDHVLIGPPGVFTVNTKHHPGGRVDVKGDAVFIGGRFVRYVDNAKLEAERATAVARPVAADLTAVPVIAIVGARVTVKQCPAGVTVLDAPSLAGWLVSLPAHLTREQIDAIYARMRWSGNWTGVAPASTAPGWVSEFARHMAAERTTVVNQRRPGRSPRSATGPRRGSAPAPNRRPRSPRSSTGPGRSRARSSKPTLSAIALRALALLVFLMALPHVVSAFTHSITSRVPGTSAPAPSTPATSAVALPGTRCMEEGATGTAPSGRAYICAAVGSKGKLVWTRA
jgi:hypothetical protein